MLVSDGVKTNRKLLRAAFERHCAASWSVSEARNGEEAVAMCEATPFDLVVMDEVFEVQGSADGPDQRLMRGSEAIAQIGAARRSAPGATPLPRRDLVSSRAAATTPTPTTSRRPAQTSCGSSRSQTSPTARCSRNCQSCSHAGRQRPVMMRILGWAR